MADEITFENSVLEGEIKGTEEMVEEITHKIEILLAQKDRLEYVVQVFKEALWSACNTPQQGEMTLADAPENTKS